MPFHKVISVTGGQWKDESSHLSTVNKATFFNKCLFDKYTTVIQMKTGKIAKNL
jgi:hypothetical protein